MILTESRNHVSTTLYNRLRHQQVKYTHMYKPILQPTELSMWPHFLLLRILQPNAIVPARELSYTADEM